jgi:serine/threonine-protein kinase
MQRTNMSPEKNSPEAMLLSPGQKFGQFRIMAVIGSGGMGQVYRARHTTLDEDFAIKILHPEITENPESLARLRTEARTAFHLKHPNVVCVEEFGEVEGRFYLRMPLMKGIVVDGASAMSLRNLLTLRGGRLGEGDAAAILRDALAGLAHAHARGVVHCDLKPGNILFNGYNALIADFGLVRVIGEDLFRSRVDETQTLTALPSASFGSGRSALAGTYSYMSPEQKDGADANSRCDVYAMGLVALEMLTGRTSFTTRRPSKSARGISRSWDAFLERALEPDASQRFPNAGEMLAALPQIWKAPVVMEGRGLHTLKDRAKPGRKTLVFALGGIALAAAVCAGVFLAGGVGKKPVPSNLPQETLPAGEPAPVAAAPAAVESAPATATVQPTPTPAPSAPVEVAGTTIPPLLSTSHTTDPVAIPSAAEPPAPVVATPAPVPAPMETVAPEPPPDKTWLEIALPGGPAMKFRRVESGSFPYGSPQNEAGRVAYREDTQRDARIEKPFYIAEYELTQAQYKALMGVNPSRFLGAENPVEQVSYSAIVGRGGLLERFNAYLALQGHKNLRARLPSEAQWECACRAGTASAFSDGSNLKDSASSGLTAAFAVCGRPFGTTSRVGSLAPNAWGLYDMHGNVEEITEGGVLRGGSWKSPARDCRSAARRSVGPSFRGDEKTGIRLVIEDSEDAGNSVSKAAAK